MNIFKKIKLFYRMSQRFGAFSRLIKQDYDMHEARRLSEEMYPPTKEDRKFEEEYIKKIKPN